MIPSLRERSGPGASHPILILGAVASLCGAVGAQEREDAPPVANAFDTQGAFGVDTTNAYFFRGILQESKGTIVQPWIDWVFPLSEGGGSSWSFETGVWNSLHDGQTGSGAPGQSAFYETDAYAGMAADLGGNWSSSLRYYVLSSPNSVFSTVQELDLSIAFDDSHLFSGGSRGFQGWQPSITVARELSGQSDGGSSKGVYLQAGIEPGLDLDRAANVPVSVFFPILAGFSLSDYFESTAGDDDLFGFAEGGLALSAPLGFVSPRLGSWFLSAGVDFLLLGDNLQSINGGDRSEVIATFGLETSF